MIQEICITDAKPAHHRAGSFIRCTVNQTPDARLYQRSRAHRARLDRRINVDTREPVVTDLPSGPAQRDDFGVRSGIAVSTRAVSENGDELIFTDDARADGHFAIRPRLACGGPPQ